MACLLKQTGNSIEIHLEGETNISAAAELKSMLLSALGEDRDFSLHLKNATTLDVCILQLIMAAGRQAQLAKKNLTIVGPLPSEISAALDEAGLEAPPAIAEAGDLCEV